jgi:dihydroorotase
MAELTITKPDDWHLHLRDGEGLADITAHSARTFARAVVMPNLQPPITRVEEAQAYRDRIIAALPNGAVFEPLMTLYLTNRTTPGEIAHAAAEPSIVAVKLYPAGATTNSEAGVTALEAVLPALEAMQEVELPLLVHGEVVDPEVDVFDREKVFIERFLEPLVDGFPNLRVVFEHITTREAVDWVLNAPPTVGATITPHHLLLDRNALFAGGIKPHHYCLPVLKRHNHRDALVSAATSGNQRFFLGTDSAPHPRRAKESAAGCAGIFNAHAALELCAEVFDKTGALDRLEGFASHHGADFYQLPRNDANLTLQRRPWKVPASYPFGAEEVVPLRAGEEVGWRVVEET